MSQKLVLAKISNKHPFLKVEVGAYLSVGDYLIIFPIEWGPYSGGRLFKGGAYLRIYSSSFLSMETKFK